jgi:hypothetical protein
MGTGNREPEIDADSCRLVNASDIGSQFPVPGSE